MRQELLEQTDRLVATLRAGLKLEASEVPALKSLQENAMAAFRRHKRARERVERQAKLARHYRAVANIVSELDAISLKSTEEDDDIEIGVDIFRQLAAALNSIVERYEAEQKFLELFIANFSSSMAPTMRVLKKLPIAEARATAKDTRDFIDSMIAAAEARRDYLLALRLSQARLEIILTGHGTPARDAADVRKLLAEVWE